MPFASGTRFIVICTIIVVYMLLAVPRPATAESELFPFPLLHQWNLQPNNVTNIAHWLDKPAGKDGFVQVRDGHFYTADEKPIRFLGVSLNYDGAFPSKFEAEDLAQHLARLGINLVRFHNMDAYDAPRGIWQPNTYPRVIDSVQLDRLDFFVAELKKHGIYSNFNMKVARVLQPQEGFPHVDERPTYDKGLDIFHEDIIAAHKQFMTDLLTHVNPYTGNRYADEPALAQIELTNENGLFYTWERGELDAASTYYLDALDELWLRWLRDRYDTTDVLRAAWGGGGDLGNLGPNVVHNGTFDQGTVHWILETDFLTLAELSTMPNAGPVLTGSEPADAARLQVTVPGAQAWLPQLMQRSLQLEAGHIYRLSFWMRVDNGPQDVQINAMYAAPPYTDFGVHTITADTTWQQFEWEFKVPDVLETDDTRITFTRLVGGQTYWLSGVEVRKASEKVEGLGLGSGESLETFVARPTWDDISLRTAAVQHDYVTFLRDVEADYFQHMYSFVKDELGVKSPVAGTQMTLSPPSVQATLDYTDMHLYWQHPIFPGGAWDGSNWYVENVSMVNSDAGLLPHIGGLRIDGKPHVISEYNTPAPNTFRSEAFLLGGAYGAFQAWDGIIAFDWSNNRDYFAFSMTGWFSLKADPVKLVTLPVAAALFVRGDVSAGETLARVALDDELDILAEHRRTSTGYLDWSRTIPRTTVLEQRMSRVLGPVDEAAGITAGLSVSPKGLATGIFTSETGELTWDRSDPDRGLVTIDTALSKAVIGYGEGRTFTFDDSVEIRPGPTRQNGWSAITMTVMEGNSFKERANILVTATGYSQNTNAGLTQSVSNRLTLHNNWGTTPVLVEGIPATITLPVAADRVRAYKLDSIGDRQGELVVTGNDRHAMFAIGPEHTALWYEITIDEKPND